MHHVSTCWARPSTASQGSVTQQELELRPVYRVGQLLESMPGLVVTVHSGEGKAHQYLVRGFNLDHGTDIANFVDDMPVNRPTNTHGQGYSDVNFIMPEWSPRPGLHQGALLRRGRRFRRGGLDPPEAGQRHPEPDLARRAAPSGSITSSPAAPDH